MPKFGWCKFAEDKFGNHARYHNMKFKMLSAIPLGFEVRKTIRNPAVDITKAVTFRVRRCNGAYGSVLKKKYQDKYNYTPAMAAVNTGTPATKTKFAGGVASWQNDLTPDQKTAYNRRANKGLRISGYNLFLREYLKS